jgi:outer membrane autotransporter protein
VSGTLAGSGTIHRNVSIAGTLSPGNPATAPYGTLTINGNLDFAPGSTLRVQTNELGQHGKVSVVGAGHSVTINGGTLEVLTGGGEYNPHTSYAVLTAEGGVTGAFDDVTSDFAFLTPSVSYDANNVLLALDRNDTTFSMFAQNANSSPGATAVAEYLDTLSPDSGAETVVNGVTQLNAAQANQSLEDLSGSSLTRLSRVSLQNTARLFEMLASRLGTRDAGAGTGLAFSTLATGGPRAVGSHPQTPLGTGLWVRQLPVEQDRGDATGAHTAMGVDAALSSGTVLGLSAVYTQYGVDLGTQAQRASRIRTPQLMGYLSHAFDGLEVRGILGCGRHRYDTERSVTMGMNSSLAGARRSASDCSGYAQAEIGNGSASTQLRPLVGVMYSRLDESAYVESGSAAALAVDRHTSKSIVSNLGLRYSKRSADERARFEARAVWSHEYGAVDSPFRASFAEAGDAGQFTVRGSQRPRDTLTLGSGIAAESRSGLLFHGDYNLQIDSDGQTRHTFVAGLRYAF